MRNEEAGEGPAVPETLPAESAPVAKRKKPRKKTRNPRNDSRYPWRREIPEDTVDPITLEALDTLNYPPFCLAAAEPYLVVPEWPVPPNEEATTETPEARQERILREQWGAVALPTQTTAAQQRFRPKYFNLFDGQALAFYMVSQLQFIDPLNRRDLTRDEVLNLDHYLRRHGLATVNVTEAYDTKGVTISSAGATAQTAAGRALILQQVAANLLQGMFAGRSVTSRRPVRQEEASSLRHQYQDHQEQDYSRRPPPSATTPINETMDHGIYGDHGMVIIDDDINPGLRAHAAPFVPDSYRNAIGDDSSGPQPGSSRVSTLWSGDRIALRHDRNHGVTQNFPALAPTDGATPQARQPAPRKPLPSSKTLARITGAVKKTDPEESRRQWEAREAARKRAMLSNMLVQPSTFDSSSTDATSPPNIEAQVERNRVLAEALGVQPATARQVVLTGWARPANQRPELDQFGQELRTFYPDALIMRARERLTEVVKLERKWINFLRDDRAASLPLNPMDRFMRTLAHEYSDFWRFQTESFDPEPKRYIHCTKLRDTRAPYPLLSDAVHQWRGPQRPPTTTVSSDHTTLQTAGQSTSGRRDIGDDPRDDNAAPFVSRFSSLGLQDPYAPWHPSQALLVGHEHQADAAGLDAPSDLLRRKEREEARLRKKREDEQLQRQVLETAFASDDEANGGYAQWDQDDDDSSWEDDDEPLNTGKDEDVDI
jgi:R3H domain